MRHACSKDLPRRLPFHQRRPWPECAWLPVPADPTGTFYAGRAPRIPKPPWHPVPRFAGSRDREPFLRHQDLSFIDGLINFADYFVLRTYREPYDHDDKPCT